MEKRRIYCNRFFETLEEAKEFKRNHGGVWMVQSVIFSDDSYDVDTALFGDHQKACDVFDEVVEFMANKLGVEAESVNVSMDAGAEGAVTTAECNGSMVMLAKKVIR